MSLGRTQPGLCLSVLVCSLPLLHFTWPLKMGDPSPCASCLVLSERSARKQGPVHPFQLRVRPACLSTSVGRTTVAPSAKQPPQPPALHLFHWAPLVFDCCFSKETASGTLTGCPESGLCLFTVNPNTGIVGLARRRVWLLLPSPLPLLSHH